MVVGSYRVCIRWAYLSELALSQDDILYAQCPVPPSNVQTRTSVSSQGDTYPWSKRLVTDRGQHRRIGTIRDGLMGKPHLTRGLGARVCAAAALGRPPSFSSRYLLPSLCRFYVLHSSPEKKATSVSGIMGNRVPAVLCIRKNSEPCRRPRRCRRCEISTARWPAINTS